MTSINTFLQKVQHIDTLTFLWVHVTKGFGYRKSVRWLSRTGDGPLYLIMAIVLVWLDAPRGQAFFWVGVIAYVIDVNLYLLLKNFIKRDRPAMNIAGYRALITPSDRFSFPSGHTAAAFVFATLVAVYYPLFALPCFVWALAVGASRVLLGVHYPTDILAGTVLGVASALSGLFIYTQWIIL